MIKVNRDYAIRLVKTGQASSIKEAKEMIRAAIAQHEADVAKPKKTKKLPVMELYHLENAILANAASEQPDYF